MTQVRNIAGLADIAGQYDMLFCDIWGVIHNGRIAFDEACHALQRFRSEYGAVILLSNSPRPSPVMAQQLAGLGVPADISDAIVTSGDATISTLSGLAPGPAFKLGPARDDVLYDGLDLQFVPLEQARFIACTGLFEDEHETPEDYRDLLTHARALNLPLVCANPDVQVRRGDTRIYCGGALAQLYGQIGGKVVYCGKPHSPIYALARNWSREILGYDTTPTRVLAMVDNIFTDLLGARNQSYPSLFIQSGLHPARLSKLNALLLEHDIPASYILSQLRW